MQTKHQAKLYGAVFFVTAAALGAAGRFYRSMPAQTRPGLIIFTALTAYFHWFPKCKRREIEKKLCPDEMAKVYNFRYLNEWLAFSQKKAVAALF
ncbi:MAG TPA: hypothetical protein GX528_07285 [Firmicutes bacterium]|nr:hypothetical protein [Bacillota bacterium]